MSVLPIFRLTNISHSIAPIIMAPYLDADSPDRSPSPEGSSLPSSDGSPISQDVAIIGFAFQFPGADNSDELWELMMSGKCVASDFPVERLSTTRYHDSNELRPGTVSNRINVTRSSSFNFQSRFDHRKPALLRETSRPLMQSCSVTHRMKHREPIPNRGLS